MIRRSIFFIVWCFVIVGSCHTVQADEFKPAFLNIKQLSTNTYDVLWRVPVINGPNSQQPQLLLPSDVKDITPRHSFKTTAFLRQQWRISTSQSLEGREIGFAQLIGGMDILFRYRSMDGSTQVQRLRPGHHQLIIKSNQKIDNIVLSYIDLGIEHILLGIDHLLFVLALLLLVNNTRRLLYTVTAFTVAHSITLSMAALGVISIPGPPVEAIIALSIIFVAVELVKLKSRAAPSLAVRYPWIVAFLFGLLHGLGFAGVLAEIGLPQHAIPLALLSFNIGVEIGQIVFIAGVLGLIAVAKRLTKPRILNDTPKIITAYMIGAVASCWFIERSFALF